MSKVKKEVLPQGFETKDLVGISYAALKQMFKAVNGRPVTVKELPKWKVVLGFVNATNSTVKTSMQCYRFVTLPMELSALKRVLKRKR